MNGLPRRSERIHPGPWSSQSSQSDKSVKSGEAGYQPRQIFIRASISPQATVIQPPPLWQISDLDRPPSQSLQLEILYSMWPAPVKQFSQPTRFDIAHQWSESIIEKFKNDKFKCQMYGVSNWTEMGIPKPKKSLSARRKCVISLRFTTSQYYVTLRLHTPNQ